MIPLLGTWSMIGMPRTVTSTPRNHRRAQSLEHSHAIGTPAVNPADGQQKAPGQATGSLTNVDEDPGRSAEHPLEPTRDRRSNAGTISLRQVRRVRADVAGGFHLWSSRAQGYRSCAIFSRRDLGSADSVVRLGIVWWSRWESNPRPLECHSSALPTELRPHATNGAARRRTNSYSLLPKLADSLDPNQASDSAAYILTGPPSSPFSRRTPDRDIVIGPALS
jgi:hypothetical protein